MGLFGRQELGVVLLLYGEVYSWLEICSKRGTIWRIGNGRKVSIWGDRWIPRPTSFTIQSPRHNQPKDMKVSELIVQTSQPEKWILYVAFLWKKKRS
jgi:hypothetical protein